MAIHKCYAFRLKLKNLLLPTPDACSPLLALSVFIGAGQLLQHGEVSNNHLRAISQEITQPAITKINMTFIYLKFLSNLPGTNELTT